MRAAGLALALLCAAGMSRAADLPCPGAVPLQTERDYLVNLKAALRSSCLLEDEASTEARLKALFGVPAVKLERGSAGWVAYAFTGRMPGAEDRGQEALVRILVKSPVDERRLLNAGVQFKGRWELTRAEFQEIWQVTPWPIPRSIHHDPYAHLTYTVTGERNAVVSLERDREDRLLRWSYDDERESAPTASPLFCSNACRAPAWAGAKPADSCPEKLACAEAAAK
ncbi:hypothetical protein [Pseudoduganella armeniaca]|uniref:Lipoprotein n=1 Tax=Pseudoduganella armeniaca TaxID=2072590 RepID=A0A2R4C6B5_9BURK|nr:hypothetical protein [Pseudoduganella armeniaca]AVR95102.1 hypothetical protein C9I28_04730 [Pseudoduganella armeniaca]